MENYSIKLEAFEGPMELLLHLIEKNKINIYDIPMADVTEQYIDYISKREFNIEIASSFTVMAATLLSIKSRFLLLKDKSDLEDTEDPRSELVQRILEYKQYKAVGEIMAMMYNDESSYIARAPLLLAIKKLPPDNLSLDRLLIAAHKVYNDRKQMYIPEVIINQDIYRVKDKIEALMAYVASNKNGVLFSEIVGSVSKAEKFVTFLALLELINKQLVGVKQYGVFEDIHIWGKSEVECE